MRKIIISIICVFCCLVARGQTFEERVVTSFGSNMQNWCSTENPDYRVYAQEQCVSACRVNDKIMTDFMINSNLNLKSYVIPNYLQGFQDAMDKGSVHFNITNVWTVRQDEQMYSFHNGSTAQQEAIRAKGFVTVACDIVVSGVLNYLVQDLYYIRNGKIYSITPYEETIDQRTGKKKVKVDFSELVDEHLVEVSYGYSSYYPLNLAVSTNFSLFNIGVEYGLNFSDEPLKFMNHTNFATSLLEGKYWYLMATPGVYLRYVSIDCGLGAVFAKYQYESVYSSDSEDRCYFMMKPKLTCHIPLPFKFSYSNNKLYISPHVAYQYVPKFSKLNCWEVGIGIGLKFETY